MNQLSKAISSRNEELPGGTGQPELYVANEEFSQRFSLLTLQTNINRAPTNWLRGRKCFC